MEDPLEREDTLAEDPLLEMAGPPHGGDLMVMEDSLDPLVGKDHQALKDHLDQ